MMEEAIAANDACLELVSEGSDIDTVMHMAAEAARKLAKAFGAALQQLASRELEEVVMTQISR